MRFAAVGDVMLGESFDHHGTGPRSTLAASPEAYWDPAVLAEFARHDVVFANVECPLSNLGLRRGSLRANHMRAAPEAALALRRAGITLANLANNHVLEHGLEAARDTAANLRDAGLHVIGGGAAGEFRPGPQIVRGSAGALRWAAIGACLLEERYAYSGGVPAAALPDVVAEAAADCDVLIVSLHWGTEYMSRPRERQRAFARELLRAGATLVIGHHPHVPQGVECQNGRLIAYSLGNFVFDQIPPDTRWSFILSCELAPRTVLSWRCIPVELDERHRPRLCAGAALIDRGAELARRHALTAAADGDYDGEAAALDAQARAMRSARLRRVWRSFPVSHALQIPLRFARRRLGLW